MSDDLVAMYVRIIIQAKCRAWAEQCMSAKTANEAIQLIERDLMDLMQMVKLLGK